MLGLPAGEWVRFELTGGLGKANTGRWSLTVRVPGQPPREFKDLAYAKPGFRKLTWIGFTSNATNTTAFHLDNFALGIREPRRNPKQR
ncbi:MAG: hypothetical protein FJ388_24835 [Verrucomicrobia bacterium]|nr:hypothetical protein [Verrucomicrobiota bacterium]